MGGNVMGLGLERHETSIEEDLKDMSLDREGIIEFVKNLIHSGNLYHPHEFEEILTKYGGNGFKSESEDKNLNYS